MPEHGHTKQSERDATISIECPISLKRRGVEMRMVLTNAAARQREPDANLVQLILRAHRYLAMLNDDGGRTLSDIVAADGVQLSEVSRILPFAFVSPSIVDSILAGSQSVDLTTQRLLRIGDLPTSWKQQSELLARA